MLFFAVLSILVAPLHHVSKLIERDGTIAVLVNFSDQGINLLGSHMVVNVIISFKDLHEVCFTNFTAVILVESLECCVQVIVSQENSAVHSGGYKLSIGDGSATINIGSLQHC